MIFVMIADFILGDCTEFLGEDYTDFDR